MPRRAPCAHGALAVPTVHGADGRAAAAAGACRRRDVRRCSAVRPLRAGAAVVAGAAGPGAAGLPGRTERGHRHGGGQYADAQPDDRQPLAGAGPVAGRLAPRHGRRPARRGAGAAAHRHRRGDAAGVGLQPPDRGQRCAGRRGRGVVLGAGHPGACAGFRHLASADAAACGDRRHRRRFRGLGMAGAAAGDDGRARRGAGLAAGRPVRHRGSLARWFLRIDRMEPAGPRGRREPVPGHGGDVAGDGLARHGRAGSTAAVSMPRPCATPAAASCRASAWRNCWPRRRAAARCPA